MRIVHAFAAFAVAGLLLAGCGQKPAPSVDRTVRGEDRPAAAQSAPDQPGSVGLAIETKEGPQPIPKPTMTEERDDVVVPGLSRLPLSADDADRRVAAYQKKLERWKALDERSTVISLDQRQTETMVTCFRDLQRLLNGYRQLRLQLLDRSSGYQETAGLSEADIVLLQQQDIDFLEGDCGVLLGGERAGGTGPAMAGDLDGVETLIEERFNEGAFTDVVQMWEQIPAYQADQAERNTTLRYGDALMFLDQPAEAAAVYRQVVEDLAAGNEQRPGELLMLRKKLGDLYAAAGDFFAAEREYELVSAEYAALGRFENWAKLQLTMLEQSMKGNPELTDYAELLRAHLGYIPESDGYGVVLLAERFLGSYPYSVVAPNVDIIKEESMRRADAWFGGLLAEAERLVADRNYEEALALLQSVPETILGPGQLQVVREKTDELILADAVERETAKLQRMQELDTRWNEAVTLAGQGDIDGAIAAYSGLLGTEYEERAAEQIDELANEAARAERRRAADLFVRSTKTADPETRKELLVESRAVLKDILDKYPDVEVSEKVAGNIEMVEKRMNEIDPSLLPAIIAAEKQQESLDFDFADPDDTAVEGFDVDVPADEEPAGTAPGGPLPVLPHQSVQ